MGVLPPLAAAPGWSAPWYAPYRDLLEQLGPHALAGRWQDCVEGLNARACARGLRNGQGRPLRFGAPGAAGSAAYEAHIWATGEVPTRTDASGGWHDFFNALVWLRFPRTKAVLNRLQAQAIAAEGIAGRRGPLRDAATLFDENAVLLRTDDPAVLAALRDFDWQALFVAGRQDFIERARVIVFGHALLDKLRAPYKAACGHAWALPLRRDGRASPAEATADRGADEAATEAVDVLLARDLDATGLRRDAFSPLPVLGVPGWWAPNADPAFYEDAQVFRPGRRYNRGRSGLDGRWRACPLEEGPDSTGQGAGQRPGAASRKTQGDGKWHREQTAEGGSQVGGAQAQAARGSLARVKR